jgi:hypothetical protein
VTAVRIERVRTSALLSYRLLRRRLTGAGGCIARDAEPWRLPLERLRGRVDDTGVERISTQAVLDVLEVPQPARRAGTYRRLAKLMAELGWSAVRVRGLTRGRYMEQVRGFARLEGHAKT